MQRVKQERQNRGSRTEKVEQRQLGFHSCRTEKNRDSGFHSRIEKVEQRKKNRESRTETVGRTEKVEQRKKNRESRREKGREVERLKKLKANESEVRLEKDLPI
ncbi:hypothetical protein DPMN_106036 [Dreissena polymorpha]|uniref:Uncharacterized protein n=1 Tax=Dreissena polymorpha TaxID=45954 RepID=A0A9D4QJF4_DREPO|nr:hypothetical protein DPMN_106036 [Dreissena polymorpha]